MADDLIARARGVRMASCAQHQDRKYLSCYRARDADGKPLDPYHLVEMVSALADALEAERNARAGFEIQAQDLRDRVVQLNQELATSRAAHEVTAQERDRAVIELAMMRAWVEQARPVVEAVRDLRNSTGNPRYQDVLRRLLFHLDLPPTGAS